MSLRVWLPLNGDLRNQGLNNISVINSNVSIDNNGKLGKCYRFETSGSYLEIPKEAMTSFETQCSMCFWFKILSWNTTYATFVQAGLGGAPWNNYIFGFLRNGSSSKCCLSISNGSSYISASCLSTTDFQLNTWYHISLIYKTGHCLIYVNGQLDQDYSTSIVPDYSKITTITLGKCNTKASYQSNCLMNDFRIYDNALSEQEIKKLAQGLILHYPLNNRGMGQENLLKRTPKSYSPGSYCGYQLNFVENLEANQPYTLQLWDIDVSHSAKTAAQTGLSFYWGGGSVNLFSFTGTSYFTDGHADYLTKTFTPTQTEAAHSNAKNAWFNVYNSIPSASGTRNMSIGAWKLEKGNTATPFNFSSFDTEYINYGLNDGVLRDISGFNNNAEYINDFTFNSDTPIYRVSTIFNHTNNYIIGESPTTQACTVTCWIKFYERGNQVVFIDYKSGCSFGIYNTYIPVCNKNISYRTCYSRDIFEANIQYFIAVVRNDTDQKMDLYVNGEKQTPSSANDTWSSNVSDKLTLGARTNGTTLFNGQMSDFRIYATALSANDIKELYEYRS